MTETTLFASAAVQRNALKLQDWKMRDRFVTKLPVGCMHCLCPGIKKKMHRQEISFSLLTVRVTFSPKKSFSEPIHICHNYGINKRLNFLKDKKGHKII